MSTLPAIPYVVGQWVRGERFYGREAQIAEILGGPRDWIWLLGTRRVGKTSLLKQLEHLTAGGEQGFFPLFWDFQGADDRQGLTLDFHDALLDAEERLDTLGIDASELDGDDLFASLGRLRRRLRAVDRTLLLLCDEVEELIQLRDKDPAVLRRLRHALQAQEGIRSVLASSIRLWTLAEQREDTSPFLHGFVPPLFIHTLTDEEARALVRQSHFPTATRPAFSDAAVETIRRRCDNHPYLLQLVAKRCLEVGDVEEACEQVASDSMVRYFFAVDFEMLSDDEREILRFICDQDQATSGSVRGHLSAETSRVNSALQQLENLGFLRRDHERRFVLANFFFRRWLQTSPASPRERTPGRSPSELSTTLSYEVRFERVDGRYELMEEAGKGATGVVYRAFDTVLETEIALKILKAGVLSDPNRLERFRREVLLARDISHPNVVRVYHLGVDRGTTYLTLQWIDGPSLARVIAEEAPLAVPEALAIAAKLASALAAAHRLGVLHRDVKPGNVLLDRQREPFLADFGLARLAGQPGLTADGVFLGTPYYASPEQAEMRPVDARSDVYSLGLVLFEMLTGRRPFEAVSTPDVLEMQRHAPPPDPRTLEPRVPADLAALVLRCLEKDAAKRPASAEGLEAELRALGS